MKDFYVRRSVESLGEYAVETVNADIIVNANENNYPMPPQIASLLREETKDFPFHRYPPLKAENLSRLIAEELDLNEECVKIGNGSSELLQIACYVFGGAGRKIAIPYPSFSMYDEYVALADSEAIRYPLTPEGFIDAEEVLGFCRRERPALLIICNPNNPTGNYNSLSDVERIISGADCPVVVDEAYMEFADAKEVPPDDMRPLRKLWLIAGSAIGLLPKRGNVIVCRTFSKAYGLAGMRCGYAAGSPSLMRQLGKALLPYRVNAYTLLTAKTVYENKELYREQLQTVRRERKTMAAFFAELGFRVWPSAANFLMIQPEKGCLPEKLYAGRDCGDLGYGGRLIFEYLLRNGILVRDFSKHPALPGALRVTVGTPEENAEIRKRFVQLCGEGKQ